MIYKDMISLHAGEARQAAKTLADVLTAKAGELEDWQSELALDLCAQAEDHIKNLKRLVMQSQEEGVQTVVVAIPSRTASGAPF